MKMADYSEFNNNNYLPGFYNDTEAAAYNHHPGMTTHFRGSSNGSGGGGALQNGFTFTTPTQCSTLATHRPSIQSMSPISISAPGVGTSWQHSIPATMPWVDTKAPTVHQHHPGTSVLASSHTAAGQEPQLHSGTSLRCPKRKALNLPDEVPASKIYLCADQFANMKISPSSKHKHDSALEVGVNTGVQFYSGAGCAKSKSDIDGWQRFRDVENRLQVELEDDIDLKMESSAGSKDGPRLTVADGVLDSCSSTSQILPHKVMQDIAKPCMQIVLWKSPGEHVREVAREERHRAKTSASPSKADPPRNSRNCSNLHKMDIIEPLPIRPRDTNIMDLSGDMAVPDRKMDVIESLLIQPRDTNIIDLSSEMAVPDRGLGSSFSAQHFHNTYSPLSTNFPALPDVVLPSSVVTSHISGQAPSVVNNGMILDLDMFDSVDDTMQL